MLKFAAVGFVRGGHVSFSRAGREFVNRRLRVDGIVADANVMVRVLAVLVRESTNEQIHHLIISTLQDRLVYAKHCQ